MLDELKSMNRDDLSDTEQIILDYFINHLTEVPRQSLSDICSAIYISNASIIRFCQKLNTSGFHDFKYNLQKDLNAQSADYDLLSLTKQKAMQLKDLMENIEGSDMEEIARLIRESSSIYIYGRDLSALIANYLYTMLMSIDIPCIYIDWVDYLKTLLPKLPKGTLLFMFTIHGNRDPYLELLERCERNDLKIVWVSTNEIDPALKKFTRYYFKTFDSKRKPNEIRTAFSSFVWVELLLETLINQ